MRSCIFLLFIKPYFTTVVLAGLEEVTPHTLRHTFARTLVAAGTPISDVADLLGHSSLDTTHIYTKSSETDLAAVVARLEIT